MMVKVALIGLGSMGQNHYRVLKNLSQEFKITALCDVQQTKDYDEPFLHKLRWNVGKVDFDAAVIVVPTFLHKEVALKCLAKGKDLFIEKPVASNNEEATAILNAAKAINAKSLYWIYRAL